MDVIIAIVNFIFQSFLKLLEAFANLLSNL